MRHLFTVWEAVKPLAEGMYVVLFSDYDGTLTPIMASPNNAKLTSSQRKTLKKLSKQEGIRFGIISGRSLSDLKKLVRIPGIIYAGNHGLELEGPKISHVHPAAEDFKKLLKKIAFRLKKAFAFLPGIIIEMKIFGISVHYRQVPEDHVEFSKMILLKEVGTYLSKSQVVLTEGKKVWEIRPPVRWNKGHTVLWLVARVIASTGKSVLPIYVGDDLTDEDSFRALQHRGITIKVTENSGENSAAVYYLRSPEEVYQFFERLLKIKKEKFKGNSKNDK